MTKNHSLIALVLAALIPVTVPGNLFVSVPSVVAQTPEQLKEKANQLVIQGIKQWQSRQFVATLESWEQALKIYQEIQDIKGQKAVLGNLATAYLELKQYHQALAVLKPALNLTRQLQNYPDEQELLFKLAQAYRDLKDEQNAEKTYLEVLQLSQKLKNSEGQMVALGSLGNIYLNLKKYAEAIAVYKQTVSLAQQISDRKSQAKALRFLGNAYYYAGDYESAMAIFDWSLQVAQQIGDRQAESSSLQYNGNAAYYLGNYEKAIDYYQRSLNIAQQLQDQRLVGQLLGNIGLVYTHLGKHQEAIDYLEQDLAIAQKLNEKLTQGQALGNLGNLYYFQKQYDKALEYYQQSLAIARQLNYQRGVWLMLTNIGAVLYKSGQLPQAEKVLNEGRELIESLRGNLGNADEQKISFFQQGSRTYQLLQQVLVAQNQTDTALEIAERSRARALVDILGNRLSSSIEESNFRPPNVNQIKQIARTQNATIVQYSIIEEDLSVNQEAKDLEVYIWLIKPTGEIIFKRSVLQQINTNLSELVSTTRDSIGVRGFSISAARPISVTQARPKGNLNQKLQQLHQILIEPIATDLPTDPNAKIIFVPDRELFLVPFPALQDGQGKYLIENHTILTAPGIQVLELTKKSRQSQRNSGEILVVGNPIMPSVAPALGESPQPLPSLPGAEQEAKAIGQIFNTQVFLGKDATKAAIMPKMATARIIHLATHGLFLTGEAGYRGWSNSIALAPSGDDNGLLTAEEILTKLRLNAELVVLSACDTGRGKISGDGVIGLSRALIGAGASSVIVSLWSVPDAPTASLMAQFYSSLPKYSNKAQALRQAMLTTMKQHPEPKNWAAFTFIGE